MNTSIDASDGCGGCGGLVASTPTALFNRPGLTSIAYRIGDYGSFRDSLHAGLSSSALPQLRGLRTRDADDFTIGLLDAVACAADVLTFYQERLANESYLRTATERVSLAELARLVGYRLRPGVAAETRLAFALEPPKSAPPGGSDDPGGFVTGIPAALTLEAGLRVQSVPAAGEKPQTFETVESIAARPEWNAVRPWLVEARAPGFGATELWLAGVRDNLKPGDALVLVDDAFLARPTSNHWDLRTIDVVELDVAADRTRVAWRRGLGSLSPHSDPARAPQVHVLRRRAGLFGNNAPRWRSMNADFRASYPADEAAPDEWPNFTASPLAATAAGGHVDLDTLLGEVRAGSLVALAKGEYDRPDENFPRSTYVELYKVTGTTAISRGEFALSGKVSRLALAGQNLDTQFFGAVRETTVFAQSERLTLAKAAVTTAVAGNRLPMAIAADGLDVGRRLIVKGERVDRAGALVHETAITALEVTVDGVVATIAPPLPAALIRRTVVVHANVATATHGESVTQILGDGDASRAQRFELRRVPLTYRGANNETGAASTVTIRVGEGNVEWTERPTLFGAAPGDRVYAVRTDEQGRVWIVFGDGVSGARLPSGVNVRVRYRQGLGRDGNVPGERLTQLLTRPPGLKGVANPVAARGGTDPEPADRARRTIPLGTRTLGRVVSLRDYEDFALAFTGIAKAQARVLPLAGGATIAIAIAGPDGVDVPADGPVRTHLLDALKTAGDPHVRVVLSTCRVGAFRIGLKVKRDPAYEAAPLLVAVEAALRAAFSFDARSIAQPVLQSEVIAAAHAVPGVVAIDLDFLYGGVRTPGPHGQALRSRQVRLLASPLRADRGALVPAEVLTLRPGPLERLEEMP